MFFAKAGLVELLKIVNSSRFISEGIVLDKDFSHPQMEKEIKDAKVLILTCVGNVPIRATKTKD